MLGVVLCGGESSRMGSDKALLKLNTQTWAQTAADKISTLQIPVVLSVRASQHNNYAAIFPSSKLVKDLENLPIKGPLCGVLSVHNQYPADDLFILACDMPMMESLVLNELIRHYRSNPGYEAYLFTSDGEPEPLCGIYAGKALAAIMQKFHGGQLPRHSMKFMLEQINTFSIAIHEQDKKYFRNFNTQEELSGLK